MQDDTTWFWQIVDARGLADVSSDETVALNELISKAERATTAESERDELLREKERLGAEVERVTSDRQYVIGWNDGFAHVNGPLRFPTMLRKMWSGGEVQAWLDAQRIEAAREAAADEGSALTRAESTISSQSERIAVLEAALRPFADFAQWTDAEGWTSNIHREGISVWFGPSDFRRARSALAPLGEE